eukprot:gene26024-56682_t
MSLLFMEVPSIYIPPRAASLPPAIVAVDFCAAPGRAVERIRAEDRSVSHAARARPAVLSPEQGHAGAQRTGARCSAERHCGLHGPRCADDPALRVTYDRFMEESRLDALAFQQRMLLASGGATFPRSIFGEKPQQLSYAGARGEAEDMMIGCVRKLFDVGRSMLLSNCLFRCGAAAVLLETRSRVGLLLHPWTRGELRLEQVVRTHMGQSDACYEAVYQREDAAGTLGVSLSKQIMQIAGDALKSNITVLAPRVLPLREQLRFFLNMIARRALQGRLPCAPAALRRAAGFTNLRLPSEYLTPSRECLREFGNTSSASIWYEMDY